MTIEQRFVLSSRTLESGKPGLFLDNDGGIGVVKPDGTRGVIPPGAFLPGAIDTQSFRLGAHTWVKPAGAKYVVIFAFGPGGGGGGGTIGPTSRSGGAGGGGGGSAYNIFEPRDLEDEVPLFVGAGGQGGGPDTRGSNGSATTTFGQWITCPPGGGGGPGGTTDSVKGVHGHATSTKPPNVTISRRLGDSTDGGNCIAATGVPGGSADCVRMGCVGGGAGCGVTAGGKGGNVQGSAGDAGLANYPIAGNVSQGFGGDQDGTVGSGTPGPQRGGTSAPFFGAVILGGSGGGGGANAADGTNPQGGGLGGFPGGGGGGAASGISGVAGTGGDGGDGFVVVICW